MQSRKRSLLLLTILLVLGSLLTGFVLYVRAVQWQHTIDRRLVEVIVDPADWDDSEMSKALLVAGADPNCRVNELPPPSFLDLFRQLLRLSSPPVNTNPTALMIACGAEWQSSKGSHYWRASSNSTLVEAMLARPVRIDAKNDKDQTALMYASTFRDAAIVSLLLQHGANPNLQNRDGETALHLAVKNAQIDTIALLLHYHADTKLKDKQGKTPSMYAETHAHPKLFPPDLLRLLR